MKFNFAIVLLVSILLGSTEGFTQNNAQEQLAYEKTLDQRATKMLAPMQLIDSAKYNEVKAMIVAQYKALNQVHEEKATQIAAEKKKGDIEQSAKEANLKSIEDAADNRLMILHKEYLARLSSKLNDNQVNEIKNGMTFGVLPVTVKAYNDMIPSLKEAEKKQILTWLTEARELAMDAGSSEEKHRIFGKYKGRINNYLSKNGYDLEKERDAWNKRRGSK